MPGPLAATQQPIVLACGIARFDALRERFAALLRWVDVELPDSGHSFRGIRSHLERHGFEVYHTHVSFAAKLATRATELGEQVESILNRSGADQCHIIAHSMGGLDARRMIVGSPGLASRVSSLTTIGTPHHGTPVADRLLEEGLADWIETLRTAIDLEGLRDLGPSACEEFNRANEAAEAANRVVYRTVWSTALEVFRPLRGGAELMSEIENDGLVPVKSQQWTTLLTGPAGSKEVQQIAFPFPADHLNQLGWWGPSDFSAPLAPLSALSEWKRRFRETETRAKDFYLALAKGLPGSPH
ncbi:MAG: triacylglycerol lipase [Limisphaerales bacterium]|jgi:triacylglycerol lipase